MFQSRIVLLTGLVIIYISLMSTQIDARVSPPIILSPVKSEGKIKSFVSEELTNTAGNIADEGKIIVDELENKLNIFEEPSEEKPANSRMAKLLFKKLISKVLAIYRKIRPSDKSFIGIIGFEYPKKDNSSTTKTPATTPSATPATTPAKTAATPAATPATTPAATPTTTPAGTTVPSSSSS